MRPFEDYFSRVADTYVRSRPTYPRELYAYLASVAPHRGLAWDCGTGNGQAAVGLADFFDHVIATDASADQLALAPPHPKIQYRAARAEESGLDNHSADLVTVAVAVHWFDFDPFFQEVKRVLAPAGAIAVWCYSLPAITPAIDEIINNYYTNVLAGYWPERFRYVQEHYRTLPFPFHELQAPELSMTGSWDLDALLGFLRSWSASTNYEKANERDPLTQIGPEIYKAWGRSESRRTIRWTLFLRVGRVNNE